MDIAPAAAVASSAVSRLQSQAPSPEERRAARAAQEFEAIMISELLKPVLDHVGAPSIAGGGGQGEAAFKGLLREEIAKSIAAQGGLGLAEHVKAELLKLQAAQSGQAAGKI